MSRTTYGYQFKKISKHDLFPFKVGRRGYCESLILSREMEVGYKEDTDVLSMGSGLLTSLRLQNCTCKIRVGLPEVLCSGCLFVTAQRLY